MSEKRIGRYTVKKKIGHGGMAAVYLAHDPHFRRDVAIKLLPHKLSQDTVNRAHFQREARTIASLDHPSIVPVYDFGEERGRLYLVMRLMTGGSLADRLEQGRIPLRTVARIIRRIGAALDEAHSKGIYHRDMKPGNLLFDQRDNVFLSDFGIAKSSEGAIELSENMIVGTPAYMSPEQAQGDADLDGRSDIYALGAILFEMLTGELPYQAATPIKLAMKHVTEPVPRIRDINQNLPIGFEALILKAMAKKRENRYPTAAALATAVTALSVSSAQPKKQKAPSVITPPPKLARTKHNSRTIVLKDPPTTPPQPLKEKKHGFHWLRWGIAVILLFLIARSMTASYNQRGNGNPTPVTPATVAGIDEPVAVINLPPTETATEQPTATTQPSATPSNTPLPTNTPLPLPTNTMIPTLTATQCPEPQLRVAQSSVNVRNGPGTNYVPIDRLLLDDIVIVIASDTAVTWYNVQLDENTRGWIAVSVTELLHHSQCGAIPVAATIPAPPLPTDTPTAVPTATSLPSEPSQPRPVTPTPAAP